MAGKTRKAKVQTSAPGADELAASAPAEPKKAKPKEGAPYMMDLFKRGVLPTDAALDAYLEALLAHGSERWQVRLQVPRGSAHLFGGKMLMALYCPKSMDRAEASRRCVELAKAYARALRDQTPFVMPTF
jgi:hypothetical protein